MTKFFRLSLLLFLSSCATKIPLSEIEDAIVSVHQVQDRQEAVKFIQSRYNFLKLLFEQSRDPYYGKFKWSQKCLEENVIGPVIDTGSSVTMNSSLYLDSKLESGFCPESAVLRYNVILTWCENSLVVNEYKIPFRKNLLDGYFLSCR